MSSRLLLAAALAIGSSASLWAQNVPHPRTIRQPVQLAAKPTDIQGVIERVMPNRVIVLVDSNSQAWQVMVPPNAKVEVSGGATAEYLRSGLFVEFTAEIDDRGAIGEKVEELTIVTPGPNRQPGLFPAESGKAGGEQDGPAAGAGADAGGVGAKPAKRVAGKGSARAGAVPAGSYRIVGKLIVGRGGKLSVLAGRGTLPLELAEQAAIAVELSDYTVAAKGDKISVKGMMMAGRPGLAQANEVKIELAEPFVGAKKKGASAKAESKRPPKRPKQDEGLPEPAADK